ncbi:MAG: bifunctional 4-hydroxy-2-oxoglutarate aldolase/2-dehydro-3-deoxy-phosphogluconate aldolase [bacterium]
MNEILTKLSLIGIVPVIKIDDVEKAVPLAKALVAGGIPCAEVTFRTEQAEEAIKRMAQEVPEMLVGAGTVLTEEQADRAVNAGAKFLISPGLNPKIVKYCVDKGYLITPGTTNPSDVEQAIELGLDVVKFFPAEAAGGLNMIKSMAAPYTKMKFMPTGGINAKNLNSYLDFDKIICCGGSWMVNEDLINNGEFDKITELCKEAVSTMLGFTIGHVGINAENPSDAGSMAETFNKMFNFEIGEGNSSIFLDKSIEIMKEPYLGAKGHIAIKTNYMSRAINYLENNGFELDESTKKEKNGKVIAIYLKDHVGGFAVHLLQK